MKIFFYIDKKRIESNNQNVPNYYTIILKNYEVKNEFQNLSFILVNNIEVNISLKIRNIFGGSGFSARMNMFNKKSKGSSESQSGVISTGISMKDRLKMFGNKFVNDTNVKNTINKLSSQKINDTQISEKNNDNNSNNNSANKKEKVFEEKTNNDNKIKSNN